MSQPDAYERISRIRAELLEVIGEIGDSELHIGPSPTAVHDDLLMVANRLGRVAFELRELPRDSASNAA
jgi:hypothetical protein